MIALSLLLCVALASDVSSADLAPAPLAKVGVIGASMTDGLLLPLELDCMVTIEDVVKAACVDPKLGTARASSSLLFRDPRYYGKGEVDRIVAARPTLVIAVDFLFWYGYGDTWNEGEGRIAGLDEGLEQIARFDCPVIVGDFPDMHVAAVKGVSITGGPIIHLRQIPDVATIAKLNEHLRAWAKDHPNVHVVPLGDLVTQIREGREMRLRGNVWPAGSAETLLDRDLLHPTLDGTIAVVLHALDLLVREDPRFAPESFEWDRAKIRERVLETKRPEREARLEMKKRRASGAGTAAGHR